MVYLKLFIVTLVLVGIAFAMLGIRMLIVKGGKFPVTSISGNKHMRELGISCTKCSEQARFNRIRKPIVKISPLDLKVIK